MARGRPLLADAPLDAQLRIRLSPAQRELLDSAASSSGLGTATWARDLLLAQAHAVAVPAGRRSRGRGRGGGGGAKR